MYILITKEMDPFQWLDLPTIKFSVYIVYDSKNIMPKNAKINKKIFYYLSFPFAYYVS